MKIINNTLYSVENEDIQNGAFIIPDGVTTIGDYAFYGCDGLTSITIPDSVTSIGERVFSYCHDLTSIIIPDSVTSISRGAFYYCRNLTSITIGDSLTNIGEEAFWECGGLTTKKSVYKAFEITKSGKIKCLKKIYTPNKWHTIHGDLKLCENGIHYCTNLFEIFNHYSGKLDNDIAIYECEVKGKDLQEYGSSKHCCRWLKPVKKLSREEIIGVLNGKGK